MQQRWETLIGIGAVLLIVGVVAGVLVAVGAAIVWWTSKVGLEYVGLTLTAAAGLATTLVVYWKLKMREIAAIQMREKIAFYSELIELIEATIALAQSGREAKFSQDILERFNRVSRGLVLIGSPNVIRAWFDVRKDPKNSEQRVAVSERLLLEIRRDLGVRNENLQEGMVLSLLPKRPAERKRREWPE